MAHRDEGTGRGKSSREEKVAGKRGKEKESIFED
jgi:hypothetical protein